MSEPSTNPCILVTDEEVTMREMVQLALEAFGYRVLTASSGTEAVAQYAAHSCEIKAVLVEMRMSRMDGEATIEALRWLDPQVRVIAATGGGREYEERAVQLEVQQLLRKPYSLEQLLHSVAAAVQATALFTSALRR